MDAEWAGHLLLRARLGSWQVRDKKYRPKLGYALAIRGLVEILPEALTVSCTFSEKVEPIASAIVRDETEAGDQGSRKGSFHRRGNKVRLSAQGALREASGSSRSTPPAAGPDNT